MIPIYRVIRQTDVYLKGSTGNHKLNPFIDIVDMVFFAADGQPVQDRTQAAYVISRADQLRAASYKVRTYQCHDGEESYEVILTSTTPYCDEDNVAWYKFVSANRPTIVKV